MRKEHRFSWSWPWTWLEWPFSGHSAGAGRPSPYLIQVTIAVQWQATAQIPLITRGIWTLGTASSIWGWTGRTGVCSIHCCRARIHSWWEHEPTRRLLQVTASLQSSFTHTFALQAFSFRHTRQKMSRVFLSCLLKVKRRMERVCWVVTMHWYDAGV